MNPERIPPLHPPRGEIPPSFWELHGTLVLVCGLVGMAVLGVLIWWWLRRGPVPPVPAEVTARQELTELKAAPETGAVLSRVSQVVRHYLGAAFGMAPVEMNTAEFSASLQTNAQVGPELAGRVTEFLHECDRRKFAPGMAAAPLGAVAVAEDLVASGERRRAELRRAAASEEGRAR